jgi:hypothetical protein
LYQANAAMAAIATMPPTVPPTIAPIGVDDGDGDGEELVVGFTTSTWEFD